MNPTVLSLCISLIFATTPLCAYTLPENFNAVVDDYGPDATTLSPETAALIDGRQPLQRDNKTHLPTFLWAAPSHTNSVLQSKAKTNSRVTIEQAARKQLARYAPLYKLSKTAQESAELQQINQLGDRGYILRFGQQVSGIEVFSRRMTLLLDNSLQVTAISGNLAPQASAAKFVFKLRAGEAIAAAFHDLHQENLPAKQLILHYQEDAYQWYALPTALPVHGKHTLSQPVRVKKVLYPLAKALESAYYIELSTQATNIDSGYDKANYAYVISAVNGALLSRHNLTHSDNAFTYRVWADGETLLPSDSPYGDDALTPLQAPIINSVSSVPSNLITLTCGPISTCDPWLPASATQTIGNNVAAYADLKAPSGFSLGDKRGQLSAPALFDYGYDFSVPDNLKHPTQLQAAIVQAFYTTNFMHDWLYDHGFNEAAGNGQRNNFKRGGLGRDRMRVEVNDYSGTDNANMTTPADGASATLQLFPWLHDPKQLMVRINGVKQNYVVTSADFGKRQFSLSNKRIVLIDDGVSITADGGAGFTSDACETPIVNAADLVGAIALIDRGSCLFVEKAKNAQEAGAIAVLIANNVPGAMIRMGGSGDPAFDRLVKIPLLGIRQDTAVEIKQALALGTVTAMMTRKQLPPYNSALDSTIVIHEWGHFLSQRLVWLNNNQGNSMGEGWSDFLALLALVKENDRTLVGNEQFQAPYAIGQYASSAQLADYPLGIRRYPYSTDFSKNPLTFKYISDGVALPVGIPVAPGTDMTGTVNSEVHNSGEVWALMLWEAYAALLNDSGRLTFREAQSRMLDYLVAALKTTPPDPTFLEARDALLAVASLRDAADYRLFWQAFAKRGAGKNAKAPERTSDTHADVVEDFTTP